jgi:ankyrin repeat protein
MIINKLKLERIRIREEKKKENLRKKKLKQIEPNLNVEEIDVNPLLEPTNSKKLEEFPLEGCSKFSDNRKILFYYFQGKSNKKAREELIRLISKDSSLANPFLKYSTSLNKDILDFAIRDGDHELVKLLLKELARINQGVSKRPTLPTSSLQSVGTGSFNKYQFGFQTRAIMLGRGGKEGNNAFTHDGNLNSHPYLYDLNHFLELDITWEALQQFIMSKHIDESSLFQYLYVMIRRGNIDLLKSKNKKDGPTLIQRLFDNMGYGFNRYHALALEDDVEGRINKLSMLKKPHTNKGINPMHVACINPNITVLRKFYSTNPEYSAADLDQRKLIHYAAANPTDVALNFLASKGVPINDKDMRGTTPLMIACELGRADNVRFLLKEQKKMLEGLDPNDEDYYLMKSSSDLIGTKGPLSTYPIHFAVMSGCIDTVKALVEGAGGDINLDVSTTDGKSPLSIACTQGYYEIAEFLLSKGVSVHENKKQKKNSLIWATQNGHIHIVSLLLRHGIHPDVPDSSGNTAAHYAAGYGWSHILKFLIENGAHPDLKNDWNSTPAMIAMLKNHFGCLDYLMELDNVDKSMVDNEGRSVISQLCMSYTKDTLTQIEYMDKFKNLDYNTIDANGWTCMHFLVANEAPQYKLQEEVTGINQKRKAELEKKLGINSNTAEQTNRPMKKLAKKKTAYKMPAYRSKMAAAAPKAGGFMFAADQDQPEQEMDVDGDEQTELRNIKVYYDQNDLKHRLYFKEARERWEDSILECAKHIYNHGLKEDSSTYDGYSTVRLAIDNGNIKVALWLINNL